MDVLLNLGVLIRKGNYNTAQLKNTFIISVSAGHRPNR